MNAASTTHLVLIPSYNPGDKVYETVRAARAQWQPVWVVVDGSTDGTAAGLEALAAEDAGLRVIVLPQNRGKGGAVLFGIERAAGEGFTHALLVKDGRSLAQGPLDAVLTAAALSACFELDLSLERRRGRYVAWAD